MVILLMFNHKTTAINTNTNTHTLALSPSFLHTHTHTHTYLAIQPSAMVLALKPSTTNTTSEASTDVMKLMVETMKASRWQLLLMGL